MPFLPRPLWRALLLAALATVAYAGAVPSGYVLDDHFAVKTNPVVQGEVPLHQAFLRDFWGRTADRTVGTYRPVALFTLALDARLAGSHAWWSHLVNVLLHALCTACAYLAWRKLADERVALAGAALFSVLAAPSEAVQAVVGRADLLATAAGVALLAAHRERSRVGAGLALAAYVVALGSKESAVSFPILLLVADVLLPPDVSSRRPRWGLFGGYAAVTLVAIAGRLIALGPAWSPKVDPILNPLAIASFSGRFFGAAHIIGERYLLGLLDPSRRLFLCSAPACGPESAASPWAWVGLIFLAGIAALAWANRRRAPGLSFALIWFLLLFGLVSNLIVISPSVYAERLLYAPLMGLSIAAAWSARALGRRLSRPILGWIPLAVFGLINLAALQLRHYDWRDEASLYPTGLAYAPDAALVRGLVAQTHMEQGDLDVAMVHARSAVSLAPESARAHETLAKVLERAGRPADAAAAYERLLALEQTERTLTNFALFLGGHGRAGEGATLLRRIPDPSPTIVRTLEYLESLDRVRSTPNPNR